MLNVPKNLRLKPFLGAILAGVEPNEYIVYFTFKRPHGWKQRLRLKGPELQIGVESEWHLLNAAGHLIVEGHPATREPSAAFPIGSKVTGFKIEPPRSFRLTFETGETLEVIAHDNRFESFSIPQENTWV